MTSADNTVVITAVSARTAVGKTATQSAMAISANIAGTQAHPYWLDKAGDNIVIAADPLLAADLPLIDRLFEMAIDTLEQVIAAAQLNQANDVVLLLGLPALSEPGLTTEDLQPLTQRIFDRLAERINIVDINLLHHGHAAGLEALHDAREYLQENPDSICIAGGVDSYINIELLEWLDMHDRLHSFNTTWGIVPGEAAGFAVLMTQAIAAAKQLPVLAELSATAVAREVNLIYTRDVCLGYGLTSALRQVLQNIDPELQQIGNVYCDLNGERYRADEYGFSVVRLNGYFKQADKFCSPVRTTGEIGAATGLVSLAWWLYQADKGYNTEPDTVIWGSSNGGQRAAVRIKKACM